MRRREFLAQAAATLPLLGAPGKLTSKERVDRALRGAEVDRPPYSFWHHFGLKTPESHAKATLDFHRAYHTDIVKVMSDFPFPKPAGKWYEVAVDRNPFPQQVRALELIRDGLGGSAYFIETLFNPWNVATKLSSKDEVQRLKRENPQALLKALDAITESEIHHAKSALKLGAAGVLLSVANANKAELSIEEYKKFSEPFDRRIMDAVRDAKLNFLHLHLEPEYLDLFRAFPEAVFNYSPRVSTIPIAGVRKKYGWTIAAGIDEVDYRKLDDAAIKRQWREAVAAAGPRLILTPGCSVPDQSTAEELKRLPAALGA